MFIGPLFSSPFFYHTSYFLVDFLHKNVKLQFFQAVPTGPQALIKSVHELVLFTEFFLRGILGLLSAWPPPPVSLLDHVSVAGRDWACSALCLCQCGGSYAFGSLAWWLRADRPPGLCSSSLTSWLWDLGKLLLCASQCSSLKWGMLIILPLRVIMKMKWFNLWKYLGF